MTAVAVRRGARVHRHAGLAGPAAATLRWGFPAGSSEHAQFAVYWFRGAVVRWRGRDAAREDIERIFAELINHAARETRGPITVVVTVAPHTVSCRVRVCGRLDAESWPPESAPESAPESVGTDGWAYGTTYWFRARA